MKHILPLLTAMGLSVSAAWVNAQPVSVNQDQVQISNAFVEKLHQLHRQQLAGKQIRQEETFGGYKDLPQFYREVSYTDAASGRVLSRIQWESARPDRIHAIEVFVYDDNGRVIRDYSAWFLPHYRNAPRETNINFYSYENGVRSWRQFDVFGNRVYEKCNAGEQVLVELWGDGISDAEDDPKSVVHAPAYRRCFAQLATTPGKFVDPQ